MKNSEKLKIWFWNLTLINTLLKWAKNHHFPGSQGISIFHVAKFFIEETRKESLNIRSNSIAFSFFLAIFPLSLFILTLLSYLPLSNIEEYLIALHDSLRPVLPEAADKFIFENIIFGLFESQRGDLLSISFILTAYFASNGMLGVLQGFEKSYQTAFRKRSVFRQRLVAMILTLIFTISILAILFLIGAGEGWITVLLAKIGLTNLNLQILWITRWILVIVVCYFIISMIYRYGPAAKVRFNFFSPGTTLATGLVILTSLLVTYFIDHFGNYNKIYGSIGAIIVTMIWMKVNAFILLVGFELNASIVMNKEIIKNEEL